MQNHVTIRPAIGADLDAIAHVADTTELFPGAMLPEMIAGYLGSTKQDIWLVAVSGAGPLGFAFCEPERMTNGTWNLLAIGVLPEFQGQGVGGNLVRNLEDVLRSGGHRVLLVETLGTPEFADTRAFYLTRGFVEEARIREFYDIGGDKVIFWKHL